MNSKLAFALFALPMGLSASIASGAKSASAAEVAYQPDGQTSVVVAQRYDDHWNQDRRSDDARYHDRQEKFRRQEFRRNEERRHEELRRERNYQDRDYRDQNYRDQNYQNRDHQDDRIWVPGHYQAGFLGFGRTWVEGHWQYRH